MLKDVLTIATTKNILTPVIKLRTKALFASLAVLSSPLVTTLKYRIIAVMIIIIGTDICANVINFETNNGILTGIGKASEPHTAQLLAAKIGLIPINNNTKLNNIYLNFFIIIPHLYYHYIQFVSFFQEHIKGRFLRNQGTFQLQPLKSIKLLVFLNFPLNFYLS